MIEHRKPIKVNEAIEKVMKYTKRGDIRYIPIEEAFGHFLGNDLIADHHVPPFDRSLYDGYAIRSEDTFGATKSTPILLHVVGEIGAGSVFKERVGSNEAVRIMTGAQIPDGCDAVIMLEMVLEKEEAGKTIIELNRSVKKGNNIAIIGEDTKKGTVIITKGTYINPGVVAILATFGYKNVPISQQPIVGIIATGSELLDVGEKLQPGRIRNSNAYMTYSQIERAGGSPKYLGQFQDDFLTCYEQINDALDQVDFLITTGGVSVGDYDYLPAIYEKMGANILFNKIAIRPGSVTTVAEKNGKLLFGLSGNPSACYVGFELFVRPVIRTYLHSAKPLMRCVDATLGTEFTQPNPFDRFVRGQLSYENGTLVATPVGQDKSSVVTSLGEANILIMLPASKKSYTKGMKVTVILLEDQTGMSLSTFLNKEFNQTRSPTYG